MFRRLVPGSGVFAIPLFGADLAGGDRPVGREGCGLGITGAPCKIDGLVDLMRPLGLVELSRTGVLSIERGAEGM